MNDIVLNGNDFLKLLYADTINDDIYKAVENILKDFVEGMPIMVAVEKHGLTYHQFRIAVAKNADIALMFEDIKNLNKEATKEKLIAKLMSLAEANDFKAISFALERMYPEEFSKKMEVKNTVIKNNPAILSKFINAEYTKVDDDNDE